MSRPEKLRLIDEPPRFFKFKPQGVPAHLLERVYLNIDEYEAIRLSDYEGLDHQAASERMEISRPTFSRLIMRARAKVAKSLVNGASLEIRGGQYQFQHTLWHCKNCQHFFRFCEKGVTMDDVCPKCNSTDIENINERHFGKKGRCKEHCHSSRE